jgi:hypothetical protein
MEVLSINPWKEDRVIKRRIRMILSGLVVAASTSVTLMGGMTLAAAAPAAPTAPAVARSTTETAPDASTSLTEKAGQNIQAGSADSRNGQTDFRTEQSVLSRLSPPGTGANQQSAPYVVWVHNRTSVNLDIKVFWAEIGVPNRQETGGTVYAGQYASYRLGGDTGCGTVLAYVLHVYYEGQLVANTGIVYPNSSDGSSCSDVWGIGK